MLKGLMESLQSVMDKAVEWLTQDNDRKEGFIVGMLLFLYTGTLITCVVFCSSVVFGFMLLFMHFALRMVSNLVLGDKDSNKVEITTFDLVIVGLCLFNILLGILL